MSATSDYASSAGQSNIVNENLNQSESCRGHSEFMQTSSIEIPQGVTYHSDCPLGSNPYLLIMCADVELIKLGHAYNAKASCCTLPYVSQVYDKIKAHDRQHLHHMANLITACHVQCGKHMLCMNFNVCKALRKSTVSILKATRIHVLDCQRMLEDLGEKSCTAEEK